MEGHLGSVMWAYAVTLMESIPELEQRCTPLLAPLVMKLDCYVVEYFCGEDERRQRRSTSLRFDFSISQFLYRESRRRVVSSVLANIGAYDHHPVAAPMLEEKICRVCAGPAEDARVLGIGVELQVAILFTYYWTEEVPPYLYFDFGGDVGDAAGGFGGVPASSASIEELEVVSYCGAAGGIREEDCVICMEELEVGKEVTRMPCEHVFHGGCLIRWLHNSHLCPLCRHAMPVCIDL